tara:strand:+ start:46 stop:243 length:198 start_codon:yes stop_codon:yes gene_type:complete
MLCVHEGSLFNLRRDSFHERLIIDNGTFEPDVKILSKHLIKKGSMVIDIVENIGIHILLFSKLVV